MKRLLILAVAALTASGCTGLRHQGSDGQPYDNPFYAKYLNTGSSTDAQITRTLEALRQNPDSPELHNALGTLLIDKGFPNDAEREFERAVNSNRKYYQAWYNLGLVRAAHGDDLGARRAFSRAVSLKPGHAQALFQLGLIEEKRHHTKRAIRLYAKAFLINPGLLRVEMNPRVLDSNLTDLALIAMYPKEHSRRSMQFQGGAPAAMSTPSAAPQPAPAPAPPPAAKMVMPTPTSTQFVEPTPVHPPSAPAPHRRGRQPRPRVPADANPTPPPAPVPPPSGNSDS